MNRAQRDAYCGSPATLYQRIAAILAPAILAGLLIYLAIIYHTLPKRIPTSFNFAGEVTGWSGRGTVWILPVVGVVTDITMLLVGLSPQTWNTGTRITVFNRARVFRLVRDLLADLRLSMALMWAGITLYILYAAGRHGWLLAAGTLVLIFAPIARYFLRLCVFRR